MNLIIDLNIYVFEKRYILHVEEQADTPNPEDSDNPIEVCDECGNMDVLYEIDGTAICRSCHELIR